MNTLTKLAINKKISAIFADGTSKMNLGISTADDKVEVEQIASVEQVAEVDAALNRPTTVGVVEQVAEAFQQLAPRGQDEKGAKGTKGGQGA